MTKKNCTTFSVQPETRTNLQIIALALGITADRGPTVGEGSASGLLDYISHLAQTEGVEAVVERLKS